MIVDNLPIKERPTLTKEELAQQVRDTIKKLDGVPVDVKPEIEVKLTAGDYKNLAKQFFMENFQSILKLGISGNPFRLAVVGIILALLILFGLGIL